MLKKLFKWRYKIDAEIDADLDKLLQDTNQIINEFVRKFSGFYTTVAVSTFRGLPINTWVELNKSAEINLISRSDTEVRFIARFTAGSLEYHQHPEAVEVLMLLEGRGKMIVRDGITKEIISDTEYTQGESYTIPAGTYHKFIVTDTAITFGILKRDYASE